jgi:DNA-binding transcriptional MerR regulator
MTAGRTYLSIGDVLTLLRQEFPDVTISKIRFLESQGLVNPERTPSGYRKFYDHDVERLRWVLRQQREHFLPLKVIKGRLEDETQTSDSQASMGNGRRSSEAGSRGVTEVAGSPRDADVGEHPSRSSTAVGLEDRGPKDRASKERGPEDTGREVPDHLPGFDPAGGPDLLERHLAGQHSRSSGSGKSGTGPSGSGPSRPLGTTTTGNAARAGGQGPPVPDRDRTFGGGLKAPWAGTAGTAGKAGTAGTAGAHEPAHSQDAWHPSSPSVARSGAHEGRAPDKSQNEPAARTSDSGRTPRAGAGRFTVAEIAAAAGLTESAIEELESYGILSSRNVGGIVHFDESELTIARVAAEFAQFGIEPRHLRLYKHASEREAGFVEQLVLPLLKQRNPEARKRASEMVADLTRLGEGLRVAMVSRSLQDLLGG